MNCPETIDVIIPIYNALDYLKLAVKSVLEKDAGHPFHLYLINDCSPDPEISNYLKTITDERVTVLENDENLGFSGTCNRGMQLTNNDVLLLNSDTEVSAGWLRKIVNCAYSHQKIGTVSPFANSGAGLLNVPDFYQRSNSIPEGYDFESWARTFEEISLYSYPRSLTNVGYCLFIKREVLNEIGYLDQATFGKGYGEETDLCLRAHEKGWLNVNDDSTFIQHEGKSSSFATQEANAKREVLIKRADEIISKKYPYVRKWLDEILEQGPTTPMHKNWWFHQDFFSSKPRIMHVVYNPVHIQWGGIEVLTKRLTSGLTDFDHYIVNINAENIDVTRVWDNWNKQKTLSIPGPFTIDPYKLENKKIINSFEEVIKLINPGVVHFQSTHKLPVDILSVPKQLNRYSIITTHDLSLFCPAYWDIDGKEGITQSIKRINQKFEDSAVRAKEEAYYTKRDALVRKNLQNVDKIITPSQYVKDLLEADYGEFKEKITVVENGIEAPTKPIPLLPSLSDKEGDGGDSKLTIAFIGTGSKHKGADAFLDIVTKDREQQFKWKMLGPIVDEQLKSQATGLTALEVISEYKNEDLDTLLADVDIVLMPSRFVETYSLVLSEVLSRGKYVISSDIGAIPARLKEYGVGNSYEIENFVEKAWSKLLFLDSHRKEVATQKAKSALVRPRLIDEMISDIKNIYEQNLSPLLQFSIEEKRKLNAKRVKYIIYTQRKWERSTMSTKRRIFTTISDTVSDVLRSTPIHKPLKKMYKRVRKMMLQG